MLGRIWVFMVSLSVVFSVINGRVDALSTAITEGAKSSVDLILSIGGMILFWNGIMEIMRRCGIMRGLSRILRPALVFLFPDAKNSPETLGNISANVSANLLGLGNAATPAGILSARGLYELSGGGCASDALCMLVVINTASLQLIPTTVSAVRASYGCLTPFDIVPAVWFASVISQSFGITFAKVFSKIWRRKDKK